MKTVLKRGGWGNVVRGDTMLQKIIGARKAVGRGEYLQNTQKLGNCKRVEWRKVSVRIREGKQRVSPEL